jgi:arylsulfatase
MEIMNHINKKNPRNKFSLLLLSPLIIVLLILSSCSRDTGSGKPEPKIKISKNLLDSFNISEKIYATKYIAASNPDQNHHFISGWHDPEKSFRWAKDKKSVLVFNASQAHDLNLETECRSLQAESSKKQKVQILLNSKKLRTIELDSLFNVFRIPLPADSVKIGENTLTFKFEWAQKPCDFSNTDDHRLLSAAFKYFKFFHSETELLESPKPFIQKKSGEVIHFPGSAFVLYSKCLPSENLEAKISRLPKNIKAYINIASDKGIQKNFVFKKPGSKKLNRKHFSGQYLKLTFYLEKRNGHQESAQDFAVWSEINILEPVQEIKIQPKLIELYNKLHAEKFDIVYIVLDAFHAQHSNLYGYHRNTTPFLKKIGEKNAFFQNFYTNSPYTLASTGTLFTARYPHEHGLIGKDTRINPELPKLQEILFRHSVPTFLITGQPWFSPGWGLSEGFTKTFYNKYQLIWAEALTQIYSHEYKDDPKFIYIHAHPPHAPYLPPKKFRVFPLPENISFSPIPQNFRKIETGEIKVTEELLDYIESMYDANILYADSMTEDIYHFFKENSLLSRTIFIISSDHGDACKMQHGRLGHNTTLYQEMVHIPFIMIFPEKLNLPPIKAQIPSSVVDAPTTILDIFGIKDDYGFKGKSLLPFIFSPEYTSAHVFLENLSGNRHQKGIIEHRYKFMSTQNGEMLFDLWNDYSEKINILSEMPVTAGYFRQLVRSYSSDQVMKINKIDFEKIDQETRERLKSLGYIK